jgi:hypothetical protein
MEPNVPVKPGTSGSKKTSVKLYGHNWRIIENSYFGIQWAQPKIAHCFETALDRFRGGRPSHSSPSFILRSIIVLSKCIVILDSLKVEFTGEIEKDFKQLKCHVSLSDLAS